MISVDVKHHVYLLYRRNVVSLALYAAEDQELYELGDAPPKPATVLDHMNCDELCSRLRLCGMPRLAEACKMKSLDGAFFVSLPKDILMKPPFSLDEFDATTQLKKIKEGWVPR